VVEFLMAVVAQKDVLTTFHAALILSIFPLSIALVATLEAFGLD
jgi:hypothetical protein